MTWAFSPLLPGAAQQQAGGATPVTASASLDAAVQAARSASASAAAAIQAPRTASASIDASIVLHWQVSWAEFEVPSSAAATPKTLNAAVAAAIRADRTATATASLAAAISQANAATASRASRHRQPGDGRPHWSAGHCRYRCQYRRASRQDAFRIGIGSGTGCLHRLGISGRLR